MVRRSIRLVSPCRGNSVNLEPHGRNNGPADSTPRTAEPVREIVADNQGCAAS
jgi:hypothetical protein